MCGLVGIFEFGTLPANEDLRTTVSSLANALVHRGPDDGGVWVDEGHGVALGHRRLSVLDLSPEGHQPMFSHNGRLVLVFNGEIYNHQELRARLHSAGGAHGFAWRGHSDTEVFLEACAVWGVQRALSESVGMFAFALWDRVTHTLTLARDRLGEKPLYYGWQDDTFLFGSELKALRAHPRFKPSVNRDALALYLRHNYVPDPYCIYKNISKLPPGTFLVVSGDASRAAKPTPYWSLREVVAHAVSDPYVGSIDDATTELDALLRGVVRAQMLADVPLGAFLSGGIDSSAVVACMQAETSRPVRTFTIGFWDRAYNEADHAQHVARHLGTDHTELFVTEQDAMEVIPSLPLAYDEPFGDSSQIATYLVSKLARQSVTVSLSGDGGDELFGGYNRYIWATKIWRKIGFVPAALRGTIGRSMTAVSPERWDACLNAFGPLIPKRLRFQAPGDKMHKLAEILVSGDRERIYKELVSHWKDPEAVVMGASEPATLLSDPSQWPSSLSFEQWMMYLDTLTYLPGDILTKVDRAAMHFSLESRIPFLDHRVLEFAWRLPMPMKLSADRGKRILRRVLDRYIPRDIIDRPKMGFGVPLDAWLRGPLRGWAEDLLAEARLQREGYFHCEPIRSKWLEHLSGRRNWSYQLWGILMFQLWLDLNMR